VVDLTELVLQWVLLIEMSPSRFELAHQLRMVRLYRAESSCATDMDTASLPAEVSSSVYRGQSGTVGVLCVGAAGTGSVSGVLSEHLWR